MKGLDIFLFILRRSFSIRWYIEDVGCRMRSLRLLENGTIVMNLGFMSTSWEERIATNPLFLAYRWLRLRTYYRYRQRRNGV
jgi:hypothetical protein